MPLDLWGVTLELPNDRCVRLTLIGFDLPKMPMRERRMLTATHFFDIFFSFLSISLKQSRAKEILKKRNKKESEGNVGENMFQNFLKVFHFSFLCPKENEKKLFVVTIIFDYEISSEQIFCLIL